MGKQQKEDEKQKAYSSFHYKNMAHNKKYGSMDLLLVLLLELLLVILLLLLLDHYVIIGGCDVYDEIHTASEAAEAAAALAAAPTAAPAAPGTFWQFFFKMFRPISLRPS